MNRLHIALVLVAGCVAAAELRDPLKVDPPHYTLEVENKFTRVFREHMTPRDTMLMHQHPMPGSLIVFITPRHNRLTYADGTAKEFSNRAGDVMWAPATSHRSENLDAINFAAIQIEPRKVATTPAPAEKLDPVVTDPKHYHVEVDNEFVRAIRVTIGPHEKLTLHKHPDTKAVNVYLTDGDMKITWADATSKPAVSRFSAGQVRFTDALAAHQDENLGDVPIQFVRVELKQAR